MQANLTILDGDLDSHLVWLICEKRKQDYWQFVRVILRKIVFNWASNVSRQVRCLTLRSLRSVWKGRFLNTFRNMKELGVRLWEWDIDEWCLRFKASESGLCMYLRMWNSWAAKSGDPKMQISATFGLSGVRHVLLPDRSILRASAAWIYSCACCKQLWNALECEF